AQDNLAQAETDLQSAVDAQNALDETATEQEVADAQTAVDDAQAAVTSAETAVSEAETAVAEAETSVAEAEVSVAEAETTAGQASDDLAEAESMLGGQAQSEVTALAEAANKSLSPEVVTEVNSLLGITSSVEDEVADLTAGSGT
ncbi:MAG: hypothetical protein GYB21_18920, partial [Oceanospirillales bacterium]|nr:hypothetical protein [Oceanospirillales bacterium]